MCDLDADFDNLQDGETQIADLLSALLSQLTFGDSPNEHTSDVGKFPNHGSFSRQRHVCGEANVWMPNIVGSSKREGTKMGKFIPSADWSGETISKSPFHRSTRKSSSEDDKQCSSVNKTESISESFGASMTVVDGYNEQKPSSVATKVDIIQEKNFQPDPMTDLQNSSAAVSASSDFITTLLDFHTEQCAEEETPHCETYDNPDDDDAGNSIFDMEEETEDGANSNPDQSSTPKRRGHSASSNSHTAPVRSSRSESSSPALSVSSVTFSEVSSLASPPSIHGDSSFFNPITPGNHNSGRSNYPPLPPSKSPSSTNSTVMRDLLSRPEPASHETQKPGMPFIYSSLKDNVSTEDLNIITESEASNIPAPSRKCAAILGNSSLAGLCKFTLDSLENKSQQSNDTDSPRFKNALFPNDVEVGEIEDSSYGNEPVNEINSIEGKEALNAEKSFVASEVAHNEINSMCQNSEDVQPNRRIQMFGSEYARFLSSNLLSPDPPKKKTAIMTKLQHMSHPGLNKNTSVRDLESAHADVLSGPVTDIVVTHGKDPPPSGFYRISHTANSSSADLSLKSGSVPVFLCVLKEPKWRRAIMRPHISALVIIFPERGETAPPGFSVVRRHRPSSSLYKGDDKKSDKKSDKSPANLNYGTNGEKIYLCFKRSRESNPITGIIPVVPSKNEPVPEGYTVIERTPSNFVADLNSSGSGKPIFIAIRQRLSNLELLRPISLLIAQMKSHKPRMSAYYCTGGTVVYSNVGFYHVMDRSTHPLLSPKSTTSKFSQYNDILSSSRSPTADAKDSSAFSELKSLKSSCSSSDFGDTALDAESIYSLSSYVECDFSSDGTDSPRRLPSSDLNLLPDDFLGLTARSLKFIPSVVDGTGRPADPSRILSMVPLLTACYTHHGGAPFVAVEGLTKLLVETDFFLPDKRIMGGNDVNNNLHTLLDLSIQTVCDIATSSAREIIFSACLEFTSKAVKYSNGILCTRTTGYLLRFYLFISSFGASWHDVTSQQIASSWPETSNICGNRSCSFSCFAIDLPLLFNCGLPYIQIGAPYAAALSLRDLFSSLMAHVESDESDSPTTTSSEPPTSYDIVTEILSDLVTSSTMKVDLSQFTQLALHQIRRAGGGEVFWHDMVNSCGVGIFGSGNNPFLAVFAMLASVVKNGGGAIRRRPLTGEIVFRDVVTKLLSLELLLHFVVSSGDKLRKSKKFGYIVRRILVQCILSNVGSGLDDARVYRRLLHLVTALWTHYREHLKVEIVVLFELLVLRVLRLGPQFDNEKGYIEQQLDALTEVVRWFDMPHNVVTLFVNYDMDVKSGVRRWKICDQLCSTLCNLAEQCNAAISEHNCSNSSTTASTDHVKIGTKEAAARILHEKSLHAISLVIKALMSASGHIYMMNIDFSVRAKSLTSSGGWEYYSDSASSDESSVSSEDLPDSSNLGSLKPTKWPFSLQLFKSPSTKKLKKPSEQDANVIPTADSPSNVKKTKQKETNILENAFSIYDESGFKGLIKAINFLVESDFISASPRDVANFLRMYQSRIDPVDLGDYLGEGGTDDQYYWNEIRYHYFRSSSFEGMNVEKGLRHLLTNCGFRLSGEAQRVDRIITAFVDCFWEDNAGDVAKCPFIHQDTVHLLAYAVIMLNTDLHKAPNSPSASSRKRKKMTQQEFVSNLLRADNCSGIPEEYLTKIYDSIEARPIQVDFTFVLDSSLPPSTDSFSPVSSHRTLTANEIKRGVKPVQELLRSLALTDHTFLTVGKDVMLSKNIIRLVVEKTWHHFYGIINSILDSPQTDMPTVLSSLDVLCYALRTTIFLGMDTERIAFTTQLARFKFIKEQEAGKGNGELNIDAGFYIMSGGHKEEPWYKKLESTCNSRETVIEAVDHVNELIQDLQSSLKGSQVSRNIKAVSRRIRNGSYLFATKSRVFIYEGDLTKICRSGIKRSYHFFLFSDCLIYAHLSNLRDFKIHGDLPLWLMKISDENETELSFKIFHPVKSFTVLAASLDEKKFWMNEINQAITKLSIHEEI
mmetsp:Transcript_4124/g.8586  ORF Transcript_4124/g.8586 Transcript_4124/m.8586 type:complete len:2013 (+) Transcript_4124:605-6643(+)